MTLWQKSQNWISGRRRGETRGRDKLKTIKKRKEKACCRSEEVEEGILGDLGDGYHLSWRTGFDQQASSPALHSRQSRPNAASPASMLRRSSAAMAAGAMGPCTQWATAGEFRAQLHTSTAGGAACSCLVPTVQAVACTIAYAPQKKKVLLPMKKNSNGLNTVRTRQLQNIVRPQIFCADKTRDQRGLAARVQLFGWISPKFLRFFCFR